MWALSLPIVEQVHAGLRRESKRSPEAVPSPEHATAAKLEFYGTCLSLVTRMIREDARKAGSALVSIQDRPTATNLLTLLLTNTSERLAYEQFLRLAMPEPRNQQEPDDLASNHILERRWPQLASGVLAQLLLNPSALNSLSARLAAERPSAWSGLLQPQKDSTATAKKVKKTNLRRGVKK